MLKVTITISFDGEDEATAEQIENSIRDGLGTACIDLESIKIETAE